MRTLGNLFREAAEKVVDDIIALGSIEAISELAEIYPTIVFPKAVGMKDVNPATLLTMGPWCVQCRRA